MLGHASRAFQIGLTRSRLQQQVPSRLYHYPATPPLANDTTSVTSLNSGISVAHPYRYHRHRHSSRIVPQNGWRRQRYALTPSRAVGCSRANGATGKTGGKTGGKGDSHVKTPKSHSAKAGLQVCQDRDPSSPHPAHPVLIAARGMTC
jgi:hypothetical protein